MKVTDIKVGADPELFLLDITTNQYKSAEGLIGGTKDEPVVISKEGFAIQEDNVMVEFNIPPAKSSTEFVNNNQFMLSYINSIIPTNLVTVLEPSVEFPWDELGTDQAMTFGCSPDENAWTGEQNKSPVAEATNIRGAGGHLHIGYSNPTIETSRRIIQCLDVFLGIPLACMEPDNARRDFYGKAGACRYKSYGVEYRTPSNFWLNTPKLMAFVFNQIQVAIEHCNDSDFQIDFFYDTVVDVINNKETEKGFTFCEQENLIPVELQKIN